jgi:hypothetical protein
MRLYLWYNLGTRAVSGKAVSSGLFFWLVPARGLKLAALSCYEFDENNTIISKLNKFWYLKTLPY